MLTVDKLIDKIKREAIETGDPANWKNIISERIKILLSPPFFNNLSDYIIYQVEEAVTSYFNDLNTLSFTQSDYEKLKQIWHDCVHSKRNWFTFFTTDNYKDHSVKSARGLIKYLEISNKVKFYEPKQTDKFILTEEDGKGELKNKQGIKVLASKGILTLYQPGDELIENVDFFIQSCPVCSRYTEYTAVLLYCPECNEIELIAYPIVEFDRMMGPEPDYDSGSQSNKRYGHDDWSDEDIDDIFEGDPDNAWNVD